MAEPTVENVLANLGRRIKDLRKARNMTQEELAGIADVSRTYMGSIEQATKMASVDVLLRISRALSVHLAELFLDPAKVPTSSRAIVSRIQSKLVETGRTVQELAKLENLIIAFLSKG